MKLIVLIFILLTFGCGNEQSVEFSLTHDFQKSEFMVTGKGLADGSTFFYFDVLLRNSDGRIVVGIAPELSVEAVSLSSATSTLSNKITCGISNSVGISRCAITSNKAGIFDVKMINAKNKVVKDDVEFTLPPKTNLAMLVEGAQTQLTGPGGYSGNGTLTHKQGPLKPITSGYTVFRGISSISESQDL